MVTDTQRQSDDLEVVVETARSTFIILAAQHTTPTLNPLNKISCKKGVPMIGHVYDTIQDSYLISCVDFLLLGNVKIAAYVQSKTNLGWRIRVPVAVPLLEQNFDSSQRAEISRFMARYTREDHVFRFLQMIQPNESFPPIKS